LESSIDSSIENTGIDVCYELLVPEVLFNSFVPGKVTVRLGFELSKSKRYEIRYHSDAFQDLAGNFVKGSSVSMMEPYAVKVSAGMPPNGSLMKYPLAGVPASPGTNIVLEFEDPVAAGDSDISVTLQSNTSMSYLIGTDQMVFLGKKVIIQSFPALDGLLPGTRYSVTIPDRAFRYVEAVAPISTRSFLVVADGEVPSAPRLEGLLVDCNGNGLLVDGNGVAELCDADQDGIREFSELDSVDGAKFLRTSEDMEIMPANFSASFRLYFSERVEIVTSQIFDGTHAELFLRPELGESIIEFVPDWERRGETVEQKGWRYDLVIPPGAIGAKPTGSALQSSRTYPGVTISFFTSIGSPIDVRPTNGASEVPLTATLRLTFEGLPRVGLSSQFLNGAAPTLSLTADAGADAITPRVIDLRDPSQAVFSGNHLIVTPEAALEDGRTYTVLVPKHAIRYMTTHYSYSFSTRLETIELPYVLTQFPSVDTPPQEAFAEWPYVLVSERVEAAAGKIRFKKDGLTTVSMDVVNSSCSTNGDLTGMACFRVDDWGTRLTFYPFGNASRMTVARSGDWGAPNCNNTIEIEAGAFRAGQRGLDALNITLPFSNLILTPPAVIDGTPSQNTNNHDPDLKFVLLTFSERVVPGTSSVAVRAWDEHLFAPQLLCGSPCALNSGTLGPIVALRFDTAVQAGAGSYLLKQQGAPSLEESVSADEAIYTGNYVLISLPVAMSPTGGPAPDVKVTSTSAVRSITGSNWATTGDVILSTVADRRPNILRTTLDDYACLSKGAMPDIVLYLDQNISEINGYISFHQCSSADCGVSGSIGKQIWQEKVSGASTSFVTFKSKFEVLLKGYQFQFPSVNPSSWFVLRLGEGLLKAGSAYSDARSFVFALCDIGFGVSVGSEISIYSPSGFGPGLHRGRKSEIDLPDSLVTDIWGNVPISSTYTFYSIPSTQHVPSNSLIIRGMGPANGSIVDNSKVNVTINFNEQIQRGNGLVRFCSAGDDSASAQGSCKPLQFLVQGLQAPEPLVSVNEHRATISFEKALMPGQKISLVLAERAFEVAGDASKYNAPLEAPSYCLELVDRDITSPFLDYVTFPRSSSEDLELFFSEAVQAGGQSVVLNGAIVGTTFDGVKVSISPPSGTWEATSYGLGSLTNSIADLANNPVRGDAYNGTNSEYSFLRKEDPGPSEGDCEGLTRRLSSLSGSLASASMSYEKMARRLADTDETNVSEIAVETHILNVTNQTNASAPTSEPTIPKRAPRPVDNTSNDSAPFTPLPFCDYDAPVLVSTYPSDGASDIPPGEAGLLVGFYYDEEVRLTSSPSVTFTTYDGANHMVEPHKIYLVENNGLGVEIPAAVLIANRTFSVSIASGTVFDRSGNFAVAATKSFSCEPAHLSIIPSTVSFPGPMDTEKPTAEKITQVVNRFDAIYIEFSEVVQTGIGYISLFIAGGACTDADVVLTVNVDQIVLVTHVVEGSLVSVLVLDPAKFDPFFRFVAGTSYSLLVPPDVFLDLAGNHFDGFACGDYTITANVIKDTESPYLLGARLGVGGIAPNSGFTSTCDHPYLADIVLYFSEAVQANSNSLSEEPVATLVPSNGSSYCYASTGDCEPGQSCTAACGYTPISNRVETVFEIRGNEVDVFISDNNCSNLRGGASLEVTAASFLDVAGNPNLPFDGAHSKGYVMQIMNSQGHGGAFIVEDVWPAYNAVGVAQSSILRFTFSSQAYAGPGNVSLNGEALPGSQCHTHGQKMSCLPAALLALGQTYVAKIEQKTVFGLAAEKTWTFTVVDADYEPPLLVSYPTTALPNESSVITLTFNEVVQIGTGSLEIKDELKMQELSTYIENEMKAYVDGSIVYLTHSSNQVNSDDRLKAGGHYTLQSSGMFEDAMGNAASHFYDEEPVTFEVVAEDAYDPEVYLSVPNSCASKCLDSDTPRASSDTNITLYFSEAITIGNSQAVVQVTSTRDSQDVSTINIPLDNSLEAQGRIEVNGSKLIIDPFHYLPNDVLVEVRLPVDGFKDLAGNALKMAIPNFENGEFQTSMSIQFKTVKMELLPVQNNLANDGFELVEGRSLLYTGTRLVLFGGMKDEICRNDLWFSISTGTAGLGVSWTQAATDDSRPKVANAAGSVDRYGCMWLLGGDCDQGLFRSCDGGVSWSKMPTPQSVPSGIRLNAILPEFPTQLRGHALTVLGGWRLVLVDAAADVGGVWKFLDEEAKYAVQVLAGSLPFGKRWRPTLLATSDARLFLVGGYSGNCISFPCSAGSLLPDVWESADEGTTWTCKTANYAVGAVTVNPEFRVQSAVMTSDDSLYVFDIDFRSAAPSSSSGIFVTSYWNLQGGFAMCEESQPVNPCVPLLPSAQPDLMEEDQVPVAPVANMGHVVYMAEAVYSGGVSIRLFDLGPDWSSKGTDVVGSRNLSLAEVDIDGSMIVVKPTSLEAGNFYRIEFPASSLRDFTNNLLPVALPTYTFRANPDVTPPVVLQALPDKHTSNVSPFTTIVLSVDEAVLAGMGILTLIPSSGTAVSMTLEAIIEWGHNHSVIFGGPVAGLENNVSYTINIPRGLLVDLAGNPLEARQVGPFRTADQGFISQIGPDLETWEPQETIGSALNLHFSERVSYLSSSPYCRAELKFQNPITNDTYPTNVTVHGQRVSVNLLPIATDLKTDQVRLLIPPNCIRDLSGLPAKFFNSNIHSAVFSLTLHPNLSVREEENRPPKETTPSFSIPSSTMILLTFSESVMLKQHGSSPGEHAFLRLVPKFSSPMLVIEPENIVVSDSKVLIIPSGGLAPGEHYTLELGKNMLQTVVGHNILSETYSYGFSLAPLINFSKSIEFWPIQRQGSFAAGITVDQENQIFMVSSKAYGPQTWSSNLWSLETGRETACAAAVAPPELNCSRKTCASAGADGLGTTQVRHVIWRAASQHGRPCVDEQGEIYYLVGTVLSDSTSECPCPLCASLPEAPYPENNMLNDSYLASQISNLIAFDGQVPMICARGYEPTGALSCDVIENRYVGKFATPYPQCVPSTCQSYPNLSAVAHGAELNCIDSLSLPIPHGANCSMRCEAGWVSSPPYFMCITGEFQLPTCVERSCEVNATMVPNAEILNAENCNESVLFGDQCEYQCLPGHTMQFSYDHETSESNLNSSANSSSVASARVSVNASCRGYFAEPESTPVLQLPRNVSAAQCIPSSCGNFTGNQSGGRIDYSSTLYGATADVTCDEDFTQDFLGAVSCAPVTGGQPGAVRWQDSNGSNVTNICRLLKCEEPTDEYGTYVPLIESDLTIRTWKLECDVGRRPADPTNLVANCSPSGLVAIPTTCRYEGGCNLSKGDTDRYESTNCPDYLKEKATCKKVCGSGTFSVGSFTCLDMEVFGNPLCVSGGTETREITKIVGALELVVWLPENAAVDSVNFVDLLKGSLAETLGIWPSEFVAFKVSRSAEQANGEDGASRRLRKQQRRLAMAQATITLVYEVLPEDSSKLAQLQADLNSIHNGGDLQEKFKTVLLHQGVQVISVRGLIAPQTVTESEVVTNEDINSEAQLAYEALNKGNDDSWKGDFIMFGFIGGMFGFTLLAAIVFRCAKRIRKRMDVMLN
jgi:hypothetical protein